MQGGFVNASKVFRVLTVAALFALAPIRSAQACVGLGCNCTVAVQDVAFGSYNPIGGATKDTVGDVAVTCGGLVVGLFFSYDIKLGAGGGGTFAGRRMARGGNSLPYQLRRDSQSGAVWGDGTSGSSMVSDSYTLTLIFSKTTHYQVFGRIPAAQNVPAGGPYTDNVTARVDF